MPVPEPGGTEDESEFMSRCMGTEAMVSEYKQDQRAAICMQQWRDRKRPKKKDAEPEFARAYAVTTIKAYGDDDASTDQRVIRGVASTPEIDRLGDIIEPLGLQFNNPAPLLHHHRTNEPVGLVTFDQPTERGLTFEAVIPRVKEPGPLRDRVETAWGEIKAGLVRGVSIGFKPGQREVMKSGGLRYKSGLVFELSLVTVPANASATISVIRSLDFASLAASGQTPEPAKPNEPAAAVRKSPGVTGKITTPVTHQERPTKMAKKTIGEQIQTYEATRVAKSARMDEIMDVATEKGETLDADQLEEYTGLEQEVKAIDGHLQLMHEREKRLLLQAKSIDGDDLSSAAASRGGNGANGHGGSAVSFNGGHVRVMAPRVEKGTGFVRYVIAMARARGNLMQALEISKSWHDTTPEVETVLRAAVTAGTTTNSTWAEPLVQYTNMAGEFIELLRPATIIGRIPGLKRVPFNIKVPRQTAGSSVNWVGETKVKPVSALAFDQVTLGFSKVAGIVTLSDELVRFSSPSAEALVRQDLTDTVAQFLDVEFVDPTNAAAAGVSPASITYNVTPVAASGTNAAALRADVANLLGDFLANNISPSGGVWIMTQQQALQISLMVNALGQPDFPSVSMEGGTFVGMPVIASENIPATGGSPTDGYPIIFLKASDVFLADDGGVNIDVSNEASLQMDSAPDSPPSATTVTVSLWQHNLTGIRVERMINWLKRRDTCCGYIANAKYA